MTTYFIDQFPRPSIQVEIEGVPPCLLCGDPVMSPSMGGPLVCGPCDCGRNRDGSRWTEDQAAKRFRHAREQVARYRGDLEPPPDPPPFAGITIGNLVPPLTEGSDSKMVTFETDPTTMDFIK